MKGTVPKVCTVFCVTILYQFYINIVRSNIFFTFQKFLQVTNGHQGGWDDIDHKMFVKLHKQKKETKFIL